MTAVTFTKDLDARLAELAEDRVSGARELAGTFLNLVNEATAARAPVVDALVEVARRIVPRQPSVAPILVGADRLFRAAERGGVDAVRAETARQIGDRARSLAFIAETAADALASFKSVAILSWSSTVAEVLDRAGSKIARVVVAESRPGLEGRRAAQRAVFLGRRVEFVADAAFPALAATCDVLLVGADALAHKGLVNKIGTAPAARAMRAKGRPVFACVEDLKIVGAALASRLRVLSEPGVQLWSGAPAGVDLVNRCFEATPLDLVTSVVTSTGAEPPTAAVERADADPPSSLWSRVPEPKDGVPLW
jgi:translation initiation factor 2B subunit (eIF-2B alpha/beta/delta family)